MDPNDTNFDPGGRVGRPDSRDYQWTEVGHGSSPFDWTVEYDVEDEIGIKIPPKNQNGSGSCGGQAWATYAAALNALFDGVLEERSARFIYAQTYVPQGGGSWGRDNANVFVKQGVADESVLTSYDNGNPPSEEFMRKSSDITPAVREQAKKTRALSYVTVPTDIDTVAQAIRDNSGVVLGINGNNNGTWTSEFPKAPETTTWRHWIYAGKAKLIDGKKYIGVLNSWGNVGREGWQWLGEDYFPGNVFEVWTHVYNPDPIVIPKYKFTATMRFGQTSADVLQLQRCLQSQGFFPESIAPTGYYGSITATAVLKFQKYYKVAFDAELNELAGRKVGPKTLAELNRQFN